MDLETEQKTKNVNGFYDRIDWDSIENVDRKEYDDLMFDQKIKAIMYAKALASCEILFIILLFFVVTLTIMMCLGVSTIWIVSVNLGFQALVYNLTSMYLKYITIEYSACVTRIETLLNKFTKKYPHEYLTLYERWVPYR